MKNSKLKPNKNIFFVTHNLNQEGASLSLFHLAVGFKKRGFNIKLISPQSGSLFKMYEKEGIDVEIKDYFSDNFSIEAKGNIFFVNTILAFKFIKKINLEENKVIWCIRESEREIYFEKYKDLEEDFFRKVNKVVFVSDETRQIYGDLENNNFETIHNGIDYKKIDEFKQKHSRDELRKKYGFENNDFIFLIVGVPCLRKGQIEFTQAAINFLRKMNVDNVKFMIVGCRGSDYENRIREIIKDKNVGEKIFLINEKSNVFDYYLASDVYVCNSYIESFPRVVLEAMAFEMPIIATNVYGIKEQIDNDESGVLIMAGDVNDLEEKMEFLFKNIDARIKLSRSARKKLEKEFPYELMLDNYLNLVNKI
jgi:glycosyltransferase involved in cell wall biosynthesis